MDKRRICYNCGTEHRRRGKDFCLTCDKPTQCQRCGIAPDDGKLHMMEIYLCTKCYGEVLAGEDRSTKIAQKTVRAFRDKAEATRMESEGLTELAQDYRSSSARAAADLEVLKVTPPAIRVSLGEAIPNDAGQQPWVKDTLEQPDLAALEASAQRTSLCLQGGGNVAALALDAANSIQAQNSLEKMLAHQLAMTHQAAMKTMSRATRYVSIDTVEQVRLMNAAVRAMEVFQRGLLTLQRLRTGGQQTVIVQHVQVADGGQAVIGQVQTGGSKKDER